MPESRAWYSHEVSVRTLEAANFTFAATSYTQSDGMGRRCRFLPNQGFGNCTLEYGGTYLTYIGSLVMDFITPVDSSQLVDDLDLYSLIRLGSCRVESPEEPPTGTDESRGAFGLVLHPVPESGKFCRVGTFHPADFPRQSDGLRFLKEESEVEEVVLV